MNSTFVYMNSTFVSCKAQTVSTSLAFVRIYPNIFKFLPIMKFVVILPLELFYSFGGYCISLHEVAPRWQSRDTASFGNDGESGESSSKEGQSCPCHVRVSEIQLIFVLQFNG